MAETPLMKQYTEMKKKHPDAILLFRVGDFYETFSDDAIAASEILGITLTRRGNGSATSVELAGFPHHALDTYLPKLVRAGRRVAICEQLEDPKLAKKLVKRGITELITPGLNLNDSTLPPRENNFLAALHFPADGKKAYPFIGVAFLDLSTGEFLCAEGGADFVEKLLVSIAPKEILRMRGTRRQCEETLLKQGALGNRVLFTEQDDWIYTPEAAGERLLRQFSTDSLKGFGVEDMHSAIIAAGSILHYLDFTHHHLTQHITSLGRIDSGIYLHLDKFTLRNLEILDPSRPDSGVSLIQVLDKTVTPMGARRLRRWFAFPLLDVAGITRRQEGVDAFFRNPTLRDALTETFRSVGDLERLSGRLATRRISPRELRQLGQALTLAAHARRLMEREDCETLTKLRDRIHDCEEQRNLILSSIAPDPPVSLSKGNYIAEGVNEELDRLRHILRHSKEALDEILQRESAESGIPSLKLGFNNVHGYYIEVRNTHKDKVPEGWIRRQTLVGAERYITPELKEYEQTIMGAGDKIDALEKEIYEKILSTLSDHLTLIMDNAAVISELDCLLSMAAAAEEYNYVRPVVNDSLEVKIVNGRHPVIERRLPPGESYIANSVTLDCDNQQIMMLTGPNMSGKSALLRQTALITLMAQTGSFVPAESAEIGIVDKIMTRVGASDNISAGESTFMVEMNEAAAILNNMSSRSLILFDELGRGTSTYDGISIAWAIVEHIHENGSTRPKTLFATHYHELNEMEKSFRRIVNYNVSVEEMNGKIVFLRKLCKGGSEHSFGIHVAKLAGMPPSIVRRADQVLKNLEASAVSPESADKKSAGAASPIVNKAEVGGIATGRDGYQLSLFQLDDPLLEQIRDALLNISIDNLTPIQALTKLHELQSLLTGK